MARYVFPDPVRELKIEVDLVADMTVYNPFDFFVEESPEQWPFDYPEDIATRSGHLPHSRTRRSAAAAFLDSVPRDETGTVDFVVGLNARLANEIGYVIRMEPGVQTPEETLPDRQGLVPRYQLAAGAGAAASRVCGALRLRLPDPAQAGRKGA
jgi:transglutaminase-like putative cysteine protease